MRHTLPSILLIALTMTGCASDGESNVRVGIGIGSFGNSGGVAVSGSTDVPVNSTKNPLPFTQIWISNEIAGEIYPDKELPFTATTEEVERLSEFASSGATPNVDEETKGKLADCLADKARCRINVQQ